MGEVILHQPSTEGEGPTAEFCIHRESIIEELRSEVDEILAASTQEKGQKEEVEERDTERGRFMVKLDGSRESMV